MPPGPSGGTSFNPHLCAVAHLKMNQHYPGDGSRLLVMLFAFQQFDASGLEEMNWLVRKKNNQAK